MSESNLNDIVTLGAELILDAVKNSLPKPTEKKEPQAVLPPLVPTRDGKGHRFASPEYPPGVRQFQPNNKQTTIMTKDGLVEYRPDWATRMLIKEGQGTILPRRIRDKAAAMVGMRGKFAKNDSRPRKPVLAKKK